LTRRGSKEGKEGKKKKEKNNLLKNLPATYEGKDGDIISKGNRGGKKKKGEEKIPLPLTNLPLRRGKEEKRFFYGGIGFGKEGVGRENPRTGERDGEGGGFDFP